MKLDYDFETDEYKISEVKLLDRGFDFYAQQTFEDEKGRRILIGWMGIPDADYTNPTVEAGWQHALTLPRELTVRDGKLVQNPVNELQNLRVGNGEHFAFKYVQKAVAETPEEQKTDALAPTEQLIGTAVDAPVLYEAVVDFTFCDSLNMTLREGITLTYANHILTLNLGTHGAGRTTRSVYVEDLQYLQIFADTSSIEIFVNHGEETFTSRIYSLEPELAISGENAGTMTLYPLGSFTIKDSYEE